MFDFGFSEMLVVGVVALVVLGPERLPTVARTAGEWVGKAQRFVAQVKSDIDRETSLSELKKIQEEARAVANDVKSSVEQAASEMEKDVKAVAGEVEASAAEIERSVDDVASEVRTAQAVSSQDIADVYGWGTSDTVNSAPTPWSNSYGGESKVFQKRYHSGPSVDELASEIERLRRELGMRDTQLGGAVGSSRRLTPRTRSNRPRIYR